MTLMKTIILMKKKIYGKEYDFNSLMDINEMSGTKKALFALRRFKSSFRMLYREIKSIFYESEKPGFERHLNGILRILKKEPSLKRISY